MSNGSSRMRIWRTDLKTTSNVDEFTKALGAAGKLERTSNSLVRNADRSISKSTSDAGTLR